MEIVRCRDCSMLYVNPIPATFATGEYYDTEGAHYYLSPQKLESDYSPVRFERELRIFRRHCLRGSVLDVGCSSGAFLYQLKTRFPGDYEVLGTDVSGPPLDYAESRGVPVVRGSFLEHDFGLRKFDAITLWAVLEHLAEPRKFLEKAAGLLKSNGHCFVLVPNMNSLAAKFLGRKYRYIYDQHLNYFTENTLAKLAAPFFTVVETKTTHFNPIVIWQDWRSKGQDVSNQERGALLSRTTAYKRNPLLAPVKAAYKSVERILSSVGMADNLAMVLRSRV
jgi:2-polyprenyl-3-methyl-5-hydroxy-6-metoxy-1,4-benzoquinol methylase